MTAAEVGWALLGAFMGGLVLASLVVEFIRWRAWRRLERLREEQRETHG